MQGKSVAMTLATGLVAIGLITTAILPGRQTPAVISTTGTALRGLFATVMGTGKKV